MKESGEQRNIKEFRIETLKPWQFKKGQSGNPAGRPKGPSLKEWTRNYLASLTDEERLEYLEGLDKAEMWKMGEGAPENKSNLQVEGNLNITKLSFDEYNDSIQPTPGQNQG